MSSTGTQTTRPSKYGSVLKAKRHTGSTCSNEWTPRIPDLGSRLSILDLLKLDVPLPRHEHGYCQAELRSFVRPAAFRQLSKWMYGQTCALENNQQIWYTYDVTRWLKLAIYNTPTEWD